MGGGSFSPSPEGSLSVRRRRREIRGGFAKFEGDIQRGGGGNTEHRKKERGFLRLCFFLLSSRSSLVPGTKDEGGRRKEKKLFIPSFLHRVRKEEGKEGEKKLCLGRNLFLLYPGTNLVEKGERERGRGGDEAKKPLDIRFSPSSTLAAEQDPPVVPGEFHKNAMLIFISRQQSVDNVL